MRLNSYIKLAIKAVPQVKGYLTSKARFLAAEPAAYKTYEYMKKQIIGLVRGVYDGYVRGDFIDTMANLISGQLTQAYARAWDDEGDGGEFPDYLQISLDEMILNQYDYVDQYYRDIIDAALDKKPIEPLLSRAELWANQYLFAYNEAVRLITVQNGGKLEWKLGATEQHCPECAALNGIVALASEWDTLGVKPQNPPNSRITCGGWRCDCSLVPTDKRRTPNAYGRIEEITS